MNPQRGDIVLVNLDPALETEAAETRPAIVISKNHANDFLATIIVLPLTGNLSRVYPHEFVLERSKTGLDYDSKAQVQYIRHVSRKRIERVLGIMASDSMVSVDALIRDHLGL